MCAKRAKKGRDCQSVKTRLRQGTAGIVQALKHARASQRVMSLYIPYINVKSSMRFRKLLIKYVEFVQNLDKIN